MADAASKAVDSALLDTWSFGDSVLSLLTDKGPVARGGDSVDMPYRAASTVNTSESGAVSSTSLSTDLLTVNRPKFINDGITQAQWAQLLNGGGNYATQLARGAGGDLMYALERDVLEYLIRTIAGAAATEHENLAADAVSEDDLAAAEAGLRETRGIANTMLGLFWIMSPRFEASARSVGTYQALTGETEVGFGLTARINRLPAYLHNGLPGRQTASRHDVATSAVTIASNVATATVAGHGMVAGQLIYTDGLTTDVAVTSPVAVTSTTATTIVYPLTAADGPLADGVGTIYSASSYGLICYAPWIGFATDGVIPFSELVKREANAGWTLQLFHHLGRAAHAGSVKIVHAPD